MACIAIAGNPNSGKSSVFNNLTGMLQRVGNYPGVTVEQRRGRARLGDRVFDVVDLPGTYSLTAYSQEELVARRFLLDEKPDVVIDVVDASNLERHLYLTAQLLETGLPLVIALNMADVAESRGMEVDAKRLSELLGVAVVRTVGSRNRGTRDLLQACADTLASDRVSPSHNVDYGPYVEEELRSLSTLLESEGVVSRAFEGQTRWMAIKLLEGDSQAETKVRDALGESSAAVLDAARRSAGIIERHHHEDAPTVIAEGRYGFAAGAVRHCLALSGEARQHTTDRIDAVVCHRLLGPLILVGVVAALFFFVFKVSDEWAWVPWFGGALSPTGIMEWAFARLADSVAGLENVSPLLHSLVRDALIGGVGGVLSFVPLICAMFLFISVLEDTGYVARVAFIVDRVFRMFGMQGKSILPLIVSGGLGAGGCAVPGVLATRTLRDEKDRIVTMLVVPFMNCGAKMPVYAMLIAAFFADRRTTVMLALWAVSWAVSLGVAAILRKILFRGEQTPFVMELPPYHVPSPIGALRHTWERTWMYIRKAGTIILAINAVMWLLMYFPRPPAQEIAQAGTEHARRAEALAHSFAGRAGVAAEPLSRLSGFDWRTNVALIGGFAAKELVVGALGTVYAMGDESEDASGDFGLLAATLRRSPAWTPLKALALMIFVMFYSPCLATIAAIRRETGSWKWPLFSTVFSTFVAFVLSTLVYQTGTLFGWGG
ncbi:ferrous iron transport protein B [Candidatus Sumerlaeota bacterium]|nr:ferrous iron transport protein B [Candidatus Sumerlaeota bacterium]